MKPRMEAMLLLVPPTGVSTALAIYQTTALFIVLAVVFWLLEIGLFVDQLSADRRMK